VYGLLALARGIDAVNEWVGRTVSWFTLAMVLVTVVIVVLRYGFSIGFIWMQESVRFGHTFVFLLCAGYTLLHNGHVRVDVYYLKMSERGKATVDIIGSILFLIPVCVAILIASWDYVLNSWAEMEGSMEERGLHAVYLLKTCIWLFSGLMIAQAVSRVIHAAATLLGIEHAAADDGAGIL
jgi:TRAP-type mannitol/chloroaromatic compound transport system permease small subunit|tara:strand:+ start:411 stop:953 length:543 start_codon:yes stop_codon:yes gene_type:complete